MIIKNVCYKVSTNKNIICNIQPPDGSKFVIHKFWETKNEN